MKQKLLYSAFVVCILFSQTIQAQKQSDCDLNYTKALSHLKDGNKSESNFQKSIDLIKPCVKLGDANAQLLMGRILLAKKGKENYKKAFKLIKKSAKQNNAIAAGDLGVLYKYGRGTNQNYNKARKWFKKGAELGNDKATYSLGYLFFKGFGTIEQNYSKAVKWFEKSDYPMAKYWLGVSYYYGYGVKKNIEKAKELIGENFDDSSNANSVTDTPSKEISKLKKLLKSTSYDIVKDESLYGKYSGVLVKYDWSGKNIEQEHSLEIVFKYDSDKQQTSYTLDFNDKKIEGTFSKIDNSIYFDDLGIEIPHHSLSKKIKKSNNYKIPSTDVHQIKKDGDTYLIGELKNEISNWNESGSKLKFVVKKKKTFSNSDKEITDDLLKALSKQNKSFIKLYPNPFKRDLIISYTLDKPSFVSVSITSLKEQKNIIIEKGIQQNSGDYMYLFNGATLKKGMYIINVITDSGKQTRIIVKK